MILITRPMEEAVKTAKKLEKHGIKTLISPILKVKKLKPKIIDFTNYDYLIFTSKNALRKKFLPSQNILVVGKRLEFLCNKMYPESNVKGFNNVLELKLFLDSNLDDSAKIIYPRGKDITLDLKKFYEKKCKAFVEQILYKTIEIKNYPIEVLDQITGVTIYSLKTAKVFNKYLKNRNLKIFTLSHTIAAQVNAENIKVFVSETPTEDSLIKLIKNHAK